jgi:hypothetical protein
MRAIAILDEITVRWQRNGAPLPAKGKTVGTTDFAGVIFVFANQRNQPSR